MFNLIVADPDWSFANKSKRAADTHYETSSIQAICNDASELVHLTDADALLGLWAPSAFVITGEAATVARAWGFEPKQMFVWLKVSKANEPRIGPGNYFRNALEPMLLCTRGRGAQLIEDKSIANWIECAGPSEEGLGIKVERNRHSSKPEEVQGLLERLVGASALGGPGQPSKRLELYARRMRSGWTCLGNELPGGGGYTP
jgi:N6-adenosine-specific RNA methylase IME4